MSEDNVYQDAEIVWVKLRSCWWPGEVCSHQRQPEGLLKHTKRKPYCVVKFFQEESFEYVKNAKMIYPFNCSKKDEFIRKGHALLAKNKYMEQFPAAVSTAERLTRSVTRSSLFYNSRPDSIIKAILTESAPQSERVRNGRQCEIVDKILQTKPTATADLSQSPDLSPTYRCSMCDFQSTRQNVMVLHRRSHSGSGRTPHRNSIVSRSIISSSKAEELQKSSDTIKADDKVPKTTLKKVVDQKLVSNETELPHVIKSTGVTEIKSDLINTVYNKNLAKERTSKENIDIVSTVFIRPPPKKQLNFINCKSENIQKSLLADWIDEEKEDEDENEDEGNDANKIEGVEIISTVNKSKNSILIASTSASAEKLRNEDFVDQKSSVGPIEPEKPTSKIRNIPKKDRRNIVFNDFNETEDIFHVHPQLQKPTNDVCSQMYFNEEKDLSKSNTSAGEIQVQASFNADFVIEEPLKISTNTGEISNIIPVGQKDKSDEDSYIPKPSYKGKLRERKSTRYEAKILESSKKIMSDTIVCPLLTGLALDKDEVTDVNTTLTATNKESPTELCITNETNSMETSTEHTASITSDTLNLSTENLKDDLSALKDTGANNIIFELSPVEQGTEQHITVEAPILDLAIDTPTTLLSATKESKTLDHTFNRNDFPNRTVEESTVDHISVEATSVETPEEESTTEEPTSVEYNLEEQTSLKSALVEPITVEQIIIKSTAEQSTEELTVIEPTSLKLCSVEPNTGKQGAVESVALGPGAAEPAAVEPAAVEPAAVEPAVVEQAAVKPAAEEPAAVEPAQVEPAGGESVAVEPFAVEPVAVEPVGVEPVAVEPVAVEPLAVEPVTGEPASLELTTVEPSTVEQSRVEQSTVEQSTVEQSTVEQSTVEQSTVEQYVVESSTVEQLRVEQSTAEQSIVEQFIGESSTLERFTPKATEILKTIEPIAGEEDENILEPNTEDDATDEIFTQIDTIEVPISLEPSGMDLNTKKTKTAGLKTAESNESNSGEPIEIEQNIVVHKRLESVTDDCLTNDLSFLVEPAAELSLTNSIIDEENTAAAEFKSEAIVLQDNAVEPNKSNYTTDISSTKTFIEKVSIQEFNSDEKPSSSKKQLGNETSITKTPNSLFSSDIKDSLEDNKIKISHPEDKADNNTLKEKYSFVDPLYSEVKISDEVSNFNTFSKSKKSADVKKELKEKRPALRSSTPRGCKRDAFEVKESFVKKRTTKASAKKIKFMDKNSSNEDETIDSSFETCKSRSLSIQNDEEMLRSLSIQNDEEMLFQKELTEKQDGSKISVEDTPNQTICETEETARSLPRESVKSDTSTEAVEPCKVSADNSDEISNAQNESNIHVPVNLELEDANQVSESIGSKPRSSFSKASLACFDFNEEEDILTSIANFKKTYVSPEKNYNFGLDSRPKTPDVQKLELEIKDKQLSEDIESLLKTTTLPANLTSSSTASVSNRPFSSEVRGLPIKERGKRIFKSRNRFRDESCASVSTTSITEVKPLSVLSISPKNLAPIEISKRVTQTQDIKTQDPAKENIIASQDEANVDAMKENEEKTMDDKVTNSEEEIIGRIVFSPAEVYAISNEETLKETVQIRESLVSSSGMEVNSDSLLMNNGMVEECANNIVRQDTNANEYNFENPTCSCATDETDEPNHNLLASYIETVCNENKELPKEVGNEQISKHVNQNETEEFSKDLEQNDGQENETLNSSSVNKEIQMVEHTVNIDNKSKDEKDNFIEDSGNAYEGENIESVYDKEMSVDEEIGKANDSICESPFEYELVTTEVSTIVDHNSNEEQNLENVKESSTEVSEEVVSCCDDGTFLNEMIIADVTESQSSVTENEIDNSNMILKDIETESGLIENATDESNSCSINENNAKIYANEENEIHVSNVEDEILQTEIDHTAVSSDDSSSIISDAEAEFGSPTSMLEEERVLNRAATPATSAEGKVYRTLKKPIRKIRKENKLIIQSLQCDTQESTSNDIVNELVYDANKYGSYVKECLTEPKLIDVRKKSFSNTPLEKEAESQENNESLEKHKEIVPDNDKDIADSNYENSDSSEEDEEEICSPPIEPLLDEDTEAENIENYSTTTSLSKSEAGPQVDREFPITSDIGPEVQLNPSDKSKTKDKISEEEEHSSEDLIRKQSDSYYTIIQKSDTIIKLNKHKEKLTNETAVKGWTETSVDVRKSELAGEELSAAEALLLIPNQPGNMLENSTDVINRPVDLKDSLAEVVNQQGLLAEDEIKEETLECSEPLPSQYLELDTKGDTPKELVRRKRRSHMKVTPRKRIINATKQEENQEESHIENKVAKLTNSPKNSSSKLVRSSENAEPQNKSFAEQYEDNFVLKYMKEQLLEEMESVESAKINTEDSGKSVNLSEKQTLEKVHITVDISNPLSSQIATILGTNRPSSTEVPIRSGVKKRKQSVEDDIPSFIIKRPCPKTIAEEEAADRETIAQIQNLCPQVEITRKSSKDDQSSSTTSLQQVTTKPHIINQQILRAGNSQPLITVTAKGNKTEEAIFDISNMPIVLSNEKIVNEKVHLVITPTTNSQLIKQFQNQHQTQLSNSGANASNFPGNNAATVAKPGIPVRRTSCVRTKRTPSRQQLPEQQLISEIQNFEQENYQQPIGVQQQPQQQQEYVHSHQQLQQHQPLIQEEHNQLQQQRQNQQGQMQPHSQFQQQLQQQQFQHHHQNQIQQQLQEEQNILFQQHHQLLLQQQLQLQQHQQQLHNQHQIATNEKASQSNLSEKQIGIDNRGNKYVIIRNPSNTVVMANSPEPCKVPQPRIPVTAESSEQSIQRKQRQKKQSPLTVQTGTQSKSPLPAMQPLPGTSPPPHILSITSAQTNQSQQYFKDQHLTPPIMAGTPAATTKPKGRGRGRPPKNKTETVSLNKQSTSNNVKVNANGRRSTGRICEPPRQRSTRSLAITTSSEVLQTVMSSAPIYQGNQQQTQSVGFMVNPQFASIPVGSSPSIRANNDSYQTQALGLSPQSRPPTAPEISIETSEVSGGGYAVPSLPVPGYPQTYLLCELIGNKYKEVFSKPLYLSPDRTRFLEVPDELVTEAHTKLSDSRREPNPNALKLVSDGTPHILQSRLIEINSENMVNQNEGNGQQNEVLMQKHQQLSVGDQASALLCLQEHLTQEQLVQNRLVQDQLVQEQLVQEQFVEEQFVQEQFVQEQFVQEQFVQEQFVQEQFVQEQFVQEQFVQEQFVPEQFVQDQFNLQPQQFSLQLARFETGEVIEDAERGQMMLVTTGTHNMILDDKSFFEFTGEKKIDFYNAEKDTYILTPQVISSLLHHYALGHITSVPALNSEIGDQQEVSIADVIQNADSSTNILEVALDESGLYSEEQFMNTGQILQIETPEGMQLIGTAAENADLIFHHMSKANTNETNVLLNQAPKMSVVEIPSDKSKRRFETKPSTPATLEDCLNVIGVPIQSPNVPTSLELPASVTNPAIVAKTRTPTPGTIAMNEIIATGLCHHPDITSLPSMSSNDQELSYEFFQSNAEAHDDKDQVNEESVVTEMGEYAVVTSSSSFDDPGR